MGEVVELSCNTTLDIPPERILRAASEANLEVAIVIGRTKDGELYFASSTPDAPEILWLIENAKAHLLNPERD